MPRVMRICQKRIDLKCESTPQDVKARLGKRLDALRRNLMFFLGRSGLSRTVSEGMMVPERGIAIPT